MRCPQCGSEMGGQNAGCQRCQPTLNLNAPGVRAGTVQRVALTGEVVEGEGEPTIGMAPGVPPLPTMGMPSNAGLPPMPTMPPPIRNPYAKPEPPTRARPKEISTPIVVSVVLGLIALVGCVGWYFAYGRPKPTLLTTQLRKYRPGDKWVYRMTGKMKMANGMLTIPLRGTYTIAIEQETFGDKPVLGFVNTLATENGLEIEDKAFCTQDPVSGVVTELGDSNGAEGAARKVMAPQGVMPGTWNAALKGGYDLTFDSGDTEQERMTIDGSEVVATPAGTFTTWKANVTSQDSRNGPITAIRWVSPQLGSYAKSEMTVSGGHDISLQLVLTLKSTTVKVW